LLKPTQLNLFGLDIRFRYTEELLRKEKESKKIAVLTFFSERRLTSIAKANPDSQEAEEEEASASRSGLRRKVFNRHGLPDEIKEIISPKRPKHENKDLAKNLHQRHQTEVRTIMNKGSALSRTE
jgi:hypothetical protein